MRTTGWNVIAAATLSLTLLGTAKAEDITIGALSSLTGPYSFAGVPSREGMMVAIDEANASGDFEGAKLTLNMQDTAGEKAQAITLMNRFGSDSRTLLVIGPTASSEAVAAGPVANDLKVPMLTATALSDDITKTGIWAFKTPAGPTDIIQGMADYAVDKMGVKKVAFVYGRDNQGMIGQKDVAKEYFPKRNVTIVSEDSVLQSDTEFMALLTKLASINPDAIYLTLAGEQAANFIVQAKQAGLDPNVKFIGTPNMGTDRFIAVGGKAIEGVVFVSDYFVGSPYPQNQKFVSQFKAKFKHEPDNAAALGYAAATLAVQAIQAAGAKPTRDAVRAALAKMQDVPTVLGNGKFRFDESRNPHYGSVVLMVKDGKFVQAP
jgi:branched-chain amino acid transport system substrate-binding protein